MKTATHRDNANARYRVRSSDAPRRRSLGRLRGVRVIGSDDPAGRVMDFLIDDRTWRVRHLVVATGRWPGRRDVLIPPADILRIEESGAIRSRLSARRIRKGSSEDLARPVSVQQALRLRHLHGWPLHWIASVFPWYGRPARVATPPLGFDRDVEEIAEPPSGERFSGPLGDRHLRSFREIRGYRVRGPDGPVGRVGDLEIEDRSWIVRDLIVAFRDGLAGRRRVQVPADRLLSVSWGDREVVVDLHREVVRRGPDHRAAPGTDREAAVQRRPGDGQQESESLKGGTGMDTKEYRMKMEAKLNELDRNIETLTLKAKQTSTEARHSVMKEIEDLRARAQKVRQRVRSAGEAGQSAWDEMRAGLEGAWTELKNAYERAAAQVS